MAELDFDTFRGLIGGLGKEELYNAVKPEVQNYADHRFGGLPRDRAFLEIFRLSYIAAGGKGPPPHIENPEELVRRMGKGRDGKGESYKTAPIHVERIYYFFLFSDERGVTSYGERISTKLFSRNFYDRFERELQRLGISRPSYLPPAQCVHLGPYNISLANDANLLPLSVEDREPLPLITDGAPSVYAALHWRSRLSGLHGRSTEFEEIMNWATDTSTKEIKVMLVNGPGGSGKTRLATDVARKLISDHNWAGGFLRAGLGRADRLFDGCGEGVVLIVDYPEERPAEVLEILRDAAANVKYDSPIRLILASRESKKHWANMLNKHQSELVRFEETSIEYRPFLETEDALAIVEDIAEEYPILLGFENKAIFLGAETWLDQDQSHRLPLIVLAAAVHAVLEPDEAFGLNGIEVLSALADFEMRRVRSYSQRNLTARNVLEKLLALSLFVSPGLLKDTIYRLGEIGICEHKGGNALLEGVQKTPFWRSRQDGNPSHLIRLEPDRFAAAFLLKALQIADPSPSVTQWLGLVAKQPNSGFAQILGRVSLDVADFDLEASQEVEQQAILLLDQHPELLSFFEEIAYEKPTVCTAKLGFEVTSRLLKLTNEAEKRAPLLHNLSNFLFDMGQERAAIKAIDDAIEIRRQLVREGKNLPELVTALNTRTRILSEQAMSDIAIKSCVEAVKISRLLAQENPQAFLPDLAETLRSASKLLVKLSSYTLALNYIEEVIPIHRRLSEEKPVFFLPELADSLTVFSLCLISQKKRKAALVAAQEATQIYQRVVGNRSEYFLPELASTLMSLAQVYSDLGKDEISLQLTKEAVEIDRRLSEVRPDVFQSHMVGSLNNLSIAYSKVGQHEKAYQVIDDAVQLLPDLSEKQPNSTIFLKIRTLQSLSVRHAKLGRHEIALSVNSAQADIVRKFLDTNPEEFLPELVAVLRNRAVILSDLEKYGDALVAINEAIKILKPLRRKERLAFANMVGEMWRISINIRWNMSVAYVKRLFGIFEKSGK